MLCPQRWPWYVPQPSPRACACVPAASPTWLRGGQVRAALAHAKCGYRQAWGEAQLLSSTGFGPECSPTRNLALLCGESVVRGQVYVSHNSGAVALMHLLLAQVRPGVGGGRGRKYFSLEGMGGIAPRAMHHPAACV